MLDYITKPQEKYDVIVVGGGFAGSSAATILSKSGLSTLVIEARDRLSGRTWFDPVGLAGHPLEWGGAFMLDRSTCPLVWDVIDEAGLELEWGSLAETDVIWLTQDNI